MANTNILKTRDDASPVNFVPDPANAGSYVLTSDSKASWVKAPHNFGQDRLRERIEPWLTALCQSEHLSLLIGSGITAAVHRIATDAGAPGMRLAQFGALGAVIDQEAERSAKKMGRSQPNLEDQLRVSLELVRGLEILSSTEPSAKAKSEELAATIESVITEFAGSLLKGERNILASKAEKREEAFNYLVSFLMSFASRTGTRDRLHIFTTNYDRLVEAGSEAAGIHLLDRFIGSLAPIFRASRLDLDIHYNPPGIRGEPRYLEGVARFTKLHGSLDWFQSQATVRRLPIPFGAAEIKPFMVAAGVDGEPANLLIYPNAAKDRETAAFPYVELFRDLAAAACRPNHTLFVFGHSLGDEHITRVIEDMLTIPSTHLVVMAFDDPLGRIMDLYRRTGRPAQVTLLIGPDVGDFRTLVDNYLPKPAIDKTTFRMAELLRSRWTGQGAQPSVPPPDGTDG